MAWSLCDPLCDPSLSLVQRCDTAFRTSVRTEVVSERLVDADTENSPKQQLVSNQLPSTT